MKRLFASRRRVLAAGALAAVAVAVASGYGYAAVTADNQTYTGCLQSGSLSNVAIGVAPLKACPKNATQISWNQTGAPGPEGDPPSLADTECLLAGGETGLVATRVRADGTLELTCESESGHQSLPVTEEVAQSAADLLFTGGAPEHPGAIHVLDIEVVPDCTGVVQIGCIGGQPVNPAPKIRMQTIQTWVEEVPHGNRFNLPAAHVVTLKSLQEIPITSSGVQCSVSLDTNNNNHLGASLEFQNLEDPDVTSAPNRIVLSNVFLQEPIADADFAISGDFLCSSFPFNEPLRGMIIDAISEPMKDDLCGAPGPALFMRCTTP